MSKHLTRKGKGGKEWRCERRKESVTVFLDIYHQQSWGSVVKTAQPGAEGASAFMENDRVVLNAYRDKRLQSVNETIIETPREQQIEGNTMSHASEGSLVKLTRSPVHSSASPTSPRSKPEISCCSTGAKSRPLSTRYNVIHGLRSSQLRRSLRVHKHGFCK